MVGQLSNINPKDYLGELGGLPSMK